VNGLLVPPGEAKPLAAAIRRLLDDPELREALGRRGRQRVEGKFYWETTCADFADLVDQPTARIGTTKTTIPGERKPQPL